MRYSTDLPMFPERVVCLSGESADICDRLGAGDRVVAVSAFAPKSMRAGRAVIGGFSTLKMDDLLSIEPDLVITFSDVQAQMAANLIRNHCTVLATNQRSLTGIVEAILLIGRVIGCSIEANKLASERTFSAENEYGAQTRNCRLRKRSLFVARAAAQIFCRATRLRNSVRSCGARPSSQRSVLELPARPCCA